MSYREVKVIQNFWEKCVPVIALFQLIAAIISIGALFAINSEISGIEDNARQANRALEFVTLLPEISESELSSLNIFMRHVAGINDALEGEDDVDRRLHDEVIGLYNSIRRGEPPIEVDFADLEAEIEHRIRFLRSLNDCVEGQICDDDTITALIGDRILDYYYYLRPVFNCIEPFSLLDSTRINTAMSSMVNRYYVYAERETVSLPDSCESYLEEIEGDPSQLECACKSQSREDSNEAGS